MTYGTQNATVCIEPSDVLCNAFSLTRSFSLSRAHLLPCSPSVLTATMFWGILGYMFVRHFLLLFGFPKTDEHPIRPTSYRGYSSPCVHLCMYPYPCSTLSVVVCVFFGEYSSTSPSTRSRWPNLVPPLRRRGTAHGTTISRVHDVSVQFRLCR